MSLQRRDLSTVDDISRIPRTGYSSTATEDACLIMRQFTTCNVNAIHVDGTRELHNAHMLSHIAAISYERRDDERHVGS